MIRDPKRLSSKDALTRLRRLLANAFFCSACTLAWLFTDVYAAHQRRWEAVASRACLQAPGVGVVWVGGLDGAKHVMCYVSGVWTWEENEWGYGRRPPAGYRVQSRREWWWRKWHQANTHTQIPSHTRYRRSAPFSKAMTMIVTEVGNLNITITNDTAWRSQVLMYKLARVQRRSALKLDSWGGPHLNV